MNFSRYFKVFCLNSSPKSGTDKSWKHSYRRFNWGFLTAVLAPFLFVSLFNIVIDPYGIFYSPTFSGFNRVKPEKFTQDFLFKSTEIINRKPTVIFLGSSRTQWGLEPLHPSLSNQNAYNLGLKAANMYVLKRYFDHALTNQPNLKQVVIGIDFNMFNAFLKNTKTFNEKRLEKKYISLQDLLNIVFSIDAFNKSYTTLITNIKHSKDEYIFIDRFMVKDSIYQNGRLVLNDQEPLPGSLQKFTRGMARGFRKPMPYKLSEEYLKDLKYVVNVCKQKNIAIHIFITPSHAIDLESLRINGLWSEFEQWKREVSKISPIWDFAYYNSIAIEPISQDMKYYIDSFHFNKDAGDLILNRLLSFQEEKVPKDFGVLIYPENIEFHLDKVRVDREVWAKNNPTLVNLVQNIQKREQAKTNNIKGEIVKQP